MADILDTAQVDIWHYRWDDDPPPDLLERLYALLSREERDRHARFRFTPDRHAYLFAHALLRRALSRYCSVPAAAWQFSQDAHGRPFIASPASGLHFNLTHTAGMAACAIGLHSEIGVDVERPDRMLDFLPLARRFFAPGEVRFLETAAPARRTEAFFTLWTLKEAYIKARGLGLTLPLREFEIRPEDDGTATIAFAHGAAPSHWHLCVFRPAASHIVSAAIGIDAAPRFLLRDGSCLL